MGDVFSGDGEGVTPDRKIFGDGEEADVGLGARVPAQGSRGNAVDLAVRVRVEADAEARISSVPPRCALASGSWSLTTGGVLAITKVFASR